MCTDNLLARVRGQLDQIDHEILKLIDRRLSLCGEIAAAKQGGNVLKLQPRRQKEVIERLGASASVASTELVRHIWRELMAHSLQLQAPTKFLLVRDGSEERLLRLLREAYGSAAPIELASDQESALGTAKCEEAVAVLASQPIPHLLNGIRIFDTLSDEGRPCAWLVGRVESARPRLKLARPRTSRAWQASSWRQCPAQQLPEYEDRHRLSLVEHRLAQRAPIVELHQIQTLTRRLAQAAEGKAIVIQGGDCAETFEGNTKERVHAMAALLSQIGATVEKASGRHAICIGRIAGQYAKPRSQLWENAATGCTPAYRGDAVNCRTASLKGRTPDPERLLSAQQQSVLTAGWLSQLVPDGAQPIYTSHEALLFNYEQAQTHYDELSGSWWAGSAHMLWLGDRTRSTAGAHAEYVRGVVNPLGVKCGPNVSSDELLQLLDLLDPDRLPGRIVLIPRLGTTNIAKKLPGLMRAVVSEGRRPVWMIDPMHGNTVQLKGRKTRRLKDITMEIGLFFDISAAEGIWPGGVHLEMTPDAVTECLGGGIAERNLESRYLTACDPRLNHSQSLKMGSMLASRYQAMPPQGPSA